MVRRFFELLLARPLAAALACLALTGALGALGTRAKPDFSVEALFPVYDETKEGYDRYKRSFPYEDAQAIVVVEAGDLWTPAGLGRVAALEADLARVDGVLYTEGLSTVKDIVATSPGELRLERLVPRPDLSPEEIARRRATASTDALFAWHLAPATYTATLAGAGPQAGATTIRVTMDAAVARKDATRMQFLLDARAVLARHEALARERGASQRLEISGLPVIRSEYTELLDIDTARLFPLALCVILALLYVTFGSAADVGAGLLTIIASVIWSQGGLGLLGYPLQMMTSMTPIIVMIISVSDTVHILTHYKAEVGKGRPPRAALADAMAEAALPCLLTEVTIACGFLSLLSVNIVAIWQFGVATALAMLLTWAANMLVLPLAITALKPAGRAGAPSTRATRGFDRFVLWIEHMVVHRPRAVVLGTAAILAVSGWQALHVGKEYYSFDDLRHDGPLYKKLRYIEAMHGGLVPLAVHIEPRAVAAGREAPEEPMLEPDAIALMDRIAGYLRAHFPEAKAASSAADYWRKSMRLFAPELARERPGGLPATRDEAAQLLLAFDDLEGLRDLLSPDHSSAAVFTLLPDVGSSRSTALLDDFERYVREEERATGYRITVTGIFAIADDIYRTLVGGFVSSFGLAILISFTVFSAVLRSWRLGLIALVPNLLPVFLTIGFMGIVGIDLKPSTVVVFSVTLTIADDDTIQYLTRFRAAFLRHRALGAPDPHAAAATETMRETGLPMFITACSVSLGFLTFLFSSLLGLANIGILLGASLFAAIFGDLFWSPLLLMRLRPRIGGEPAAAGEARATAEGKA